MNLTDEQVEQAAKAAQNIVLLDGQRLTPSEAKEVVRAAAPYLQMPQEMPTDEECERFYDVYLHAGGPTPKTNILAAINDLFARRNAALTATVDPRRKVIGQVLNKRYGNVDPGPGPRQQTIDEIIEQLDMLTKENKSE